MNISNYVKIALFFIVLGVGGSVYIISTSDGMSDFNTVEYEAIIADATGLTTRSKIYLAGVAVGRVKDITLTGNEAVLRLAMLKDVQLREDAVISRKSSSILGTSILTLDPGIELTPILNPGGRVHAAKEQGDLDSVLATASSLGGQISLLLRDFQENQLALLSISLETINSIAQKINFQSDAEIERISRILESVALITERMERIMAQGENPGIGPAADIYGTLENIRTITDEIGQGRGNFGQAVFDDQLYLTLLSTMQLLEESADKLREVLGTVNTVAESAGTVIDNANIVVEKAIGLGIQVDASGKFFIQTNHVQAGASVRLVPQSDDRWYRIGVSSAPEGYTTRTVIQTVDSSGKNTEEITETKYSVFAIDAELARRFGIITIRGGLIENTGGIGFDLHPFDWADISTEIFNFQTGTMPNLRGTLTFYPFFDPDSDKPWNWVYLRGGINDSLNDNRGFFLGGGMRFADREVKGLVGLIPVFN
jgi:phospholipid/cholesterol/gamma-HCH transport system substrate-binding protein